MNSTPKRGSIGDRTVTLKAVPFFTQLSDRELDIVRGLAVEKTYPRSAVVLTEGEMGDSLYMIQSGKVKVFIGDEEGREIILKILGPGAFFGEMSMIDKQPRSASAPRSSRPPSTSFRTRRSRSAWSRRRASPRW
jgi:CRP/FNR family transcriptional regulator, cyclic AMP receptor protein